VTGKQSFPQLISGPFLHGLVIVQLLIIVLSLAVPSVGWSGWTVLTMRGAIPVGQRLSPSRARVQGQCSTGLKTLPPMGMAERWLILSRPCGRPDREMVAMMLWYGSHWAFWQASLMWVGMIAFWGLLIWGIYVLIRSANRGPGGREHGGDARSILDERLARGEISSEDARRPTSSGKAF
jgi:uncharacterized membrane protein